MRDVDDQRADAESQETDMEASVAMHGLVELTQGQEASLGDFRGSN